jgi:hypothetical protein
LILIMFEYMNSRPLRLYNRIKSLRPIQLSLILALMFSSILIIAAARGDLWLDEIWSILFASDAHSITDIFTLLQHDNNHPLNTLFLYFLGEQKNLFLYRLFAVTSGIASVFLVAWIAKKEWGWPEALCVVILTSTSFPLLLYYSEARGYAPAIFFVLTSYMLLSLNFRRFSWKRLPLFWVTSILGLLSHGTFVIGTIAFCMWTMAHEVRSIGRFQEKLFRFMAYHTPPVLFLMWWYAFFLRVMKYGEGPEYPIWDVIAQASKFLLGFPDDPDLLIPAIICTFILIIAGVIALRREQDERWIFFINMLCISPAILLIATRPKFIYFRYLIVCFPFFYLLVSHLICKYYGIFSNLWKCLIIAALAILLAGQGLRDELLLRFGRGNYSAALEYIENNSQKDVINVGSDHDFRNKMLFDFYNARMPLKNKMRYIEQDNWGKEPPDWIITHSQDTTYQCPKKLTIKKVGVYYFTKEYKFSDVSGWNWFLFRRTILSGESLSLEQNNNKQGS